MSKTVFTTGEVAAICGVSADTVSRWFDLGQIDGYRLGPGGDRRIPREKLRQFMLKHGIPLDRLDGEKIAILLVDSDPGYLSNVSAALRQIKSVEVLLAENAFECGLKVAECKPQLIIVEVELPDLDAIQLARRVKSREETQYTCILGMGNGAIQQNTNRFLDAGMDALIGKPFSGGEILAKAQELLNLPPGKINRPKHPIAV